MAVNPNPFYTQDINEAQRSERVGIVAKFSGEITNDVAFFINDDATSHKQISSYIRVGGAGNIILQNAHGTKTYIPNVQVGELIPGMFIAVLSVATINGNPRTTTATNLTWFGGQ